jgi:hypothetical protein
MAILLRRHNSCAPRLSRCKPARTAGGEIRRGSIRYNPQSGRAGFVHFNKFPRICQAIL